MDLKFINIRGKSMFNKRTCQSWLKNLVEVKNYMLNASGGRAVVKDEYVPNEYIDGFMDYNVGTFVELNGNKFSLIEHYTSYSKDSRSADYILIVEQPNGHKSEFDLYHSFGYYDYGHTDSYDVITKKGLFDMMTPSQLVFFYRMWYQLCYGNQGKTF